MDHRRLVAVGVSLGLFAADVFAQKCRPGSIELDVNIQCACVKAPGSEQCQMYMRNKSMYDGKGLQPAPGIGVAPTTNPSLTRVQQASVPQGRTPVSPTPLPADAALWQMVPSGTKMAIGMRPQWLTPSPLLDQLLNMGGQVGGQSMETIRRAMTGVETVILATRLGGQLLILARAADVVRTTKSERDAYRYADPNTILVGDWNETNAAMRRLFSQDPMSAEAKMAARVAPHSDLWIVVDPSVIPGGQFQGATKVTVGLATRDDVTLEVWLDTLGALPAKNLAARLEKNPQGMPLFGQLKTVPTVEQRDNAVRLYARVPQSQLTGTATPHVAPGPEPLFSTVKRAKLAEVQTGMDRAAVEALLGKPNSVTSIQGTDEPIETLVYNLDDKGTARVRTVNGKVVSVQPLN